jgi:hypothetical protein
MSAFLGNEPEEKGKKKIWRVDAKLQRGEEAKAIIKIKNNHEMQKKRRRKTKI